MENQTQPAKRDYIDVFHKIFGKAEMVISLLLAIIILIIVFVALIRIIYFTYTLIVLDLYTPKNISFEDYKIVFGRVMTLLISLEFMNSIIKILKTHEMRTLILDVLLITVLAISRKLIIFDYDHHEPDIVFGLGFLLISIGIVYFLVKFSNFKNTLSRKPVRH